MVNSESSTVDQFETKVAEFQVAMQIYQTHLFYKNIGFIVSVLIISLQMVTVIQVYQACFLIQPVILLLCFVVAYLLTDLINGLIHMYMDNNTHYSSIVGPFIASFHLHHLSPRYGERHPLKIYFYESGTKFWLAIYLCLLVVAQVLFALPFYIHFSLVCVGILSSVAELSHFWCHNSKNRVIQFLQKNKILLSRKHHLIHHLSDNKNYAFLNGLTDPLINIISRYLYMGYKNNSDQHAKAYAGQQTINRR